MLEGDEVLSSPMQKHLGNEIGDILFFHEYRGSILDAFSCYIAYLPLVI